MESTSRVWREVYEVYNVGHFRLRRFAGCGSSRSGSGRPAGRPGHCARFVERGGASSIDITRPGEDKAYGIRKLKGVLGIPIEEMIFVGDALFPAGNDEPAHKTGIVCIKVRELEETARAIKAVTACMGG